MTVHYAGTFIDGETFDSSFERGEPATFPLGRLIKAWQMAIPEMGVGDTIEIAAPADLAYGAGGKGPIPGGATLLFTVKLIGISSASGLDLVEDLAALACTVSSDSSCVTFISSHASSG